MRKKRVLFIGIGFYDYDQAIIKAIQEENCIVDYFCETPSGSRYRYLLKVNRSKIPNLIAKQSLEIANNCRDSYDVIFIIKCEYLTTEALEMIFNKNPKSRKILYLWDSIARIKNNIEEKLPFFDTIYSFDRLDVIKYGFILKPLFFREEFEQKRTKNNNYSTDILFLGLHHSDRVEIVSKIAKNCKEQSLTYDFTLYASNFTYYRDLIFSGELKGKKKFLTFKAISNFEYLEKLSATKSVLDITHPQQSGLTMRTIELLGGCKKIITTNEEIAFYDFYNSKNICVIDRNNPVLTDDFLERDYKYIDSNIYEKYKLRSWVKTILDSSGENYLISEIIIK